MHLSTIHQAPMNPSKALSKPYSMYVTNEYNLQYNQHTVLQGILHAYKIVYSYNDDMNSVTAMILGKLQYSKMYRRFSFSRKYDGPKKDLMRQMQSGDDTGFLTKFLAKYFEVCIVTISQFNAVNVYNYSQYRDTIVFKEMLPDYYVTCRLVNEPGNYVHRDVRNTFGTRIEAHMCALEERRIEEMKYQLQKFKLDELEKYATENNIQPHATHKDDKRTTRRRTKSNIILDIIKSNIHSNVQSIADVHIIRPHQ